MQFTLDNPSSYPVVGAWVWGSDFLPCKVTRRYRRSGVFLTLVTPRGDRTLPLTEVTGWCPELPIGSQIVSDTGWLATITGFDPELGMYRVEGECIIGWLYPDQFSAIQSMEVLAAS